MIGFLRKNFPAVVTAETVKKFSLASNNESYVINALQFVGVIDEEGKRTPAGHNIFVLSDDDFPKAFEGLIREGYNDLFDLRGEDAWTMSRTQLVAYFRQTDKTSETIAGRQAGVFTMFRTLAGYAPSAENANSRPLARLRTAKVKTAPKGKVGVSDEPSTGKIKENAGNGKREMAMTVRIEINLPANGSKETYDNIFKSIRANLINE